MNMKHAIIALTFGLTLSVAGAIYAQIPAVKNPTKLTFTSPDHANATGYEVDILNGTTGALVQTLITDKGTITAGVVTLILNVQPIAFGSYTFKTRPVAGPVKGEVSVASDPWERTPLATSKPVVQ